MFNSPSRYCLMPGTWARAEVSCEARSEPTIATASAKKCRNSKKLTVVRISDFGRAASESVAMARDWE